MHIWAAVVLLSGFYSSLCVLANTEIVNFDAEEWDGVLIPDAQQWPVLQFEDNEKLWKIKPAPLGTALEDICKSLTYSLGTCPHELWVVLDLDSHEWQSYSKFTLRISWPAFSPTDFSIQIHSPRSAHALWYGRNLTDVNHEEYAFPSTVKTRRAYALIRLVTTGVRTPSVSHMPAFDEAEPVSFMILLEPLYFRVLPESVIPILIFLLPVLLCASFILVPFVNHYLSQIAIQARAEIRHKKTN